jgi:hypothetical protein
MSTDVTANGRSILHKGHGMTHVCAPPDVCKTPTPGGPVPIPYVNIAMDRQLTKGAKTVKIENNPVAKVNSKISTSMGDEPGTVGGIISSKFKGAMSWPMGSLDVKAEGKSVVRFLDTALHNGNSFNSVFIDDGGTGFAYGDDAPCDVCKEPYEKHLVHETPEVRARAAGLLRAMNEIYEAQRELVERAFQTRTQLKGMNSKNRAVRRAMPAAARPGFDAALAACAAVLAGINGGLEGTHLLVMDDDTDTYTQGYMVGVCMCRCGAKAIAASSAREVTPGFRQAVANCGLELADAMPALSANQQSNVDRIGKGIWTCAAPKMINALKGHKPRTMTEMYFQRSAVVTATYNYTDRRGTARTLTRTDSFPRREGVKVVYRFTARGDTHMVENTFGSGETTPSCDRCKVNLPEMLCKADEPCP